MKFHRLTVDTYAAQHPGRPSHRDIYSISIETIGGAQNFHLVRTANLQLVASEETDFSKSKNIVQKNEIYFKNCG